MNIHPVGEIENRHERTWQAEETARRKVVGGGLGAVWLYYLGPL